MLLVCCASNWLVPKRLKGPVHHLRIRWAFPRSRCRCLLLCLYCEYLLTCFDCFLTGSKCLSPQSSLLMPLTVLSRTAKVSPSINITTTLHLSFSISYSNYFQTVENFKSIFAQRVTWNTANVILSGRFWLCHVLLRRCYYTVNSQKRVHKDLTPQLKTTTSWRI